MSDEADRVSQMSGTATASFTQMPIPRPPVPVPVSYRRLIEKTVNSIPSPKMEARPDLGPLIDEANRLLADSNTTNDAFLDIYKRIMMVPPSE